MSTIENGAKATSEFIVSLENILISLVPSWGNQILTHTKMGGEYSMLATFLLSNVMKFFLHQQEQYAVIFIGLLIGVLIAMNSGWIDTKKMGWTTCVEIKEEFIIDLTYSNYQLNNIDSERFYSLQEALLKLPNITKKPISRLKRIKFLIQPTLKEILLDKQDGVYVHITNEIKELVEIVQNESKTIKKNILVLCFRQYGRKKSLTNLMNKIETLISNHPLPKKFELTMIKKNSIEGLTTTIKSFHYYAIKHMKLDSMAFMNYICPSKKYKNYEINTTEEAKEAKEAKTTVKNKEKPDAKPKVTFKLKTEEKEEDEIDMEESIENFIFPDNLQNYALLPPYENISFSVEKKLDDKKEELIEYKLEASEKSIIDNFLKTIREEYNKLLHSKFTYTLNSYEIRTISFTTYEQDVSITDIIYALNYYLITQLGIPASDFIFDNYVNTYFFLLLGNKIMMKVEPQIVLLPGNRKLVIKETQVSKEEYIKNNPTPFLSCLTYHSKYYKLEYKIISHQNDIKEFMLPIMATYNQLKENTLDKCNNKKKKLYYFIYNGMNKSKEPIFTSRLLSGNDLENECFETFDHLHQEYTEKLKADLIRLRDIEYYRKRGLKRKKGYLFYGKPGTGKTSSVTAMALFSQRHIISINFNLLKYHDELDILMNIQHINGYDICPNNAIWLFDEIECGLKKYSREIEVLPPCSSQLDMIVQSMEYAINKETEPCENQYHLDIATILSSMDGIGVGNGQIIVGTTNNLELIDKAIYRELRMTPYEFRELRQIDAINIIQKYFDCVLTPEQQSRIPDRHFIPAKLINLCDLNQELMQLDDFLTNILKV